MASQTIGDESQTLEWKTAWQDDHLRWICGFANADGGTLVVGKDNAGRVVGLPNARALSEELPNKIRDLLGIIVTMDLRGRRGAEYLEIKVPPCPNPISYRGRHYQRSGSTLQELRGAALDRFLLRRYGRTWDSSPLPGVAVGDLSPAAIAVFRGLAKLSGRLGADALLEDDGGLLDKLKLTDGAYLKRAAAMLFHPDPTKFASGAYVKIAHFTSGAELAYQDEVTGDLFTQARGTLDFLFTKYLKAAIGYEDIVRVERFPVPRTALREAVLNALVHRDYMVSAPTQIRVYDDRLMLWNPAVLPDGWSTETLLKPHPSMPFNPDIANVFFRAGEIEAWGRGIERIFIACRDAGTPIPDIHFDGSGLWTEFAFASEYLQGVRDQATPKVTPKTPPKNATKTPPKTPKAILDTLRGRPTLTVSGVAEALGKSRSAVLRGIKRLREEGRLRHEGPKRGGHWKITG